MDSKQLAQTKYVSNLRQIHFIEPFPADDFSKPIVSAVGTTNVVERYFHASFACLRFFVHAKWQEGKKVQTFSTGEQSPPHSSLVSMQLSCGVFLKYA